MIKVVAPFRQVASVVTALPLYTLNRNYIEAQSRALTIDQPSIFNTAQLIALENQALDLALSCYNGKIKHSRGRSRSG
jgi:hypothetical protein